jgi:hypothetical protein
VLGRDIVLSYIICTCFCSGVCNTIASAEFIFLKCKVSTRMPPWRNWLARSAVNRKDGGSSPPGGVSHFFLGVVCDIVFGMATLTSHSI